MEVNIVDRKREDYEVTTLEKIKRLSRASSTSRRGSNRTWQNNC